jgi:hypothetical protein
LVVANSTSLGKAKRDGEVVGRMTGGGTVVDDARVTYGFQLHCDASVGPNRLQVNWGKGNKFHLEALTSASCSDDPELEPGSSGANFDTHEGNGTGRYKGVSGAMAQWIFKDAGEPGKRDYAEILITDIDGNVVLAVCDELKGGNHRAHGSAPPAPTVFPMEDPPNVVNTARIKEDGTSCLHRTAPIPDENFGVEPPDPGPKEDDAEVQEPPKIHPLLEQRLAEQGPFERVDVLINLQDDLTIPRFPDLPLGETRDGPIAQALEQQQDEMIQGLLEDRTQAQAAFVEDRTQAQAAFVEAFEEECYFGYPGIDDVYDGEFDEVCDVEPKEHFWLVNGFLAEIALGALDQLAEFDEVLSVDPRFGGEMPPQDANQNNDVVDGRAQISSDPYFNVSGTNRGYIGLLDTGVRATHTLFSAPADHVDFLRDCSNGGANCNDTSATGFNTNDDCHNHGTSSAGIISGNNNRGNNFRGVTAITLDSWKIYPTSFDPITGFCNGGLDSPAAVRAFQAGLAVWDRVFVAEIQSIQGPTGTIATAADNAFDAGAVVIAANGNNGRTVTGQPIKGSVNSPAVAHKVIGVGAYHVDTLGDYVNQSRGPAPDNRYKPDIRAPNNSETASNTSNTALTVFTGTSGSTPYAAGGAALLRNWLRKFKTYDPGQVYVQLIEAANRPACRRGYNNVEGAGDLQLITGATPYWGKVIVPFIFWNKVDIKLTIGSGKTGLEAALWWPEGATETHSDIDLFLIDPSGTVRGKGISGPSVFERARVCGALAPGKWTLRIKGQSGPIRLVYWVADVRD